MSPISKEQREKRRLAIGSSDSPAIVGVDPYRTAADVWVEKTQDLEERESNDQIEIGNEFERPLLQWAARELGVEIEENMWWGREDIPFAANLDALVVGKPEALEAKTGSAKDYGDPGTDQVPDRVLVQVHHQMLVADLQVVWVPVLVAKFDHLERALYKVERNETLIDMVREKGVAFWENHVLPKVAPPDMVPNLDVLKRVRRVPKSVAIVDASLVAAYVKAQEDKKLAEEQEDNAKAILLAAMGDAEAADYGDPAKWYTYYETSRTTIDGKALRKAHPAIAEQFSTESKYRTLRNVKR